MFIEPELAMVPELVMVPAKLLSSVPSRVFSIPVPAAFDTVMLPELEKTSSL